MLQVLDHVGIYMLIAGSYTPLMLISLHHHNSARVLLTAEWIAAACGSVFATCSDLNAPMTMYIELGFFVSMGLGVLLITDIIAATLSYEELFLLFLGGGFYLSGIIFFILGEIKPIYHTVWHLFVVCAAAIHWFEVYFYVIETDLNTPAKQVVSAVAEAMQQAVHHAGASS